MSRFVERLRSSCVDPPHGDALCWIARTASLAWGIYSIYGLALCLVRGEDFVLSYVIALVGLLAALSGLRWHLVPAIPLISLGVPYLAGQLLHDPVVLCPQPILFAVGLLAAGMANIAAFLKERVLDRHQPPQRLLGILAGIACGLPGLALCVVSLWSYSTLGDDCEWGQDSMLGGLTVLVAVIGLVVSFTVGAIGALVFNGAWRLWHRAKS